MREVNIYIETSIRGPARRDGAYLYILECFVNGIPVTREGRGRIEAATQNQLALTALKEALERLTESCSVRVFTGCDHILNATRNFWVRQWQKNNWMTARGATIKNAEEWEAVLRELDKHVYQFTNEDHSYSSWMKNELKEAYK